MAECEELLAAKEQQLEKQLEENQKLLRQYEDLQSEMRELKDKNYEVMMLIQQEKHTLEGEITQLRQCQSEKDG